MAILLRATSQALQSQKIFADGNEQLYLSHSDNAIRYPVTV